MALKPPLDRSSTLRVGLLLLAITSTEAVVLLWFFGLGGKPLVLFDHQLYHQLAVNLLDHKTFSMDATPPYRPMLYRSPGFPAFIALVYALAGRSVVALRVAQFILAWLTSWLLYLAG